MSTFFFHFFLHTSCVLNISYCCEYINNNNNIEHDLCLQEANNVSVVIGKNMKLLENIHEINCEIELHIQ